MVGHGGIGAARQRPAEVHRRFAPLSQRGECATEVGVGIRVTRLKRDISPVVCDGFLRAAQSGKRQPHVVVIFRDPVVQRDSLGEEHQGRIGMAGLVREDTELVEAAGMLRVELQRASEQALGLS